MQLWKGLTWSEAVRISWLLTWRGLVIGFFAGFFIGAVVGLFTKNLLMPALLTFPFSVLIVGPAVTAQALRKNFKGFRLAIVRERVVRKRDPSSPLKVPDSN